ncbi:MAG TPA: glycosyltransferase family 1 protein [Chloroflexota bacterium]
MDSSTDYRLLYATSPYSDLAALPEQANVSARRLPLNERWQTIAWQRLRLPLWADLLAGGADVFHSPDFVLPPVRRARTAVTVHDLTFVVRPECAEPSLRRYLAREVPRSLHRADRVLADSQSTADDLMRLFGVPARRLEVVYSAADARFRPLDAADAEALLDGIEAPRPFILTVGTLEPRKNVSRLIDAFASLDVPHQLVVVGARGWLFGDVLTKLRQPRVFAPERVSDDQLVGLYNLADAFVLPSLYEGFGLPALEAMACGTPVAVSNVSSLPEVVGSAGLTFDPEDTAAIATAVRRLANDPALREELRAAGLEQAQRFSWRTSALQLKGIYESFAA